MKPTVCYVFNGDTIMEESSSRDNTLVIPRKGDYVKIDGQNYEISDTLHKLKADGQYAEQAGHHRVIIILKEVSADVFC